MVIECALEASRSRDKQLAEARGALDKFKDFRSHDGAERKAHEQTREIARELAAALEESAHLGCWCQWAAGHSQKCQKLQAALAKYHARFPEQQL